MPKPIHPLEVLRRPLVTEKGTRLGGEEGFAGSGIRTWYLVKAIPPDLPEDGFVYSSVVVR